MDTTEKLHSNEHTDSLGTNTSQASTQVPHSQDSTAQNSISQTVPQKFVGIDLDQNGETTFRKVSIHAESVNAPNVQTVEVDGLQYAKPGPAWTETTNVPQEHLSFIQVVGFMINQSVGVGIFYTPGSVLLLTKSKVVSVGLWIAGGIYTILSACVFLEFSTALPYNGGPLIYLDEVFPSPKMLAAIIFSWYWILLCSNLTSAITAAIYILQLYYPDATYGEIDPKFAQFLGIVLTTVACLLLYFLLQQCLLVNSIFAGFKVIMLVVFFIAGIAHACKDRTGLGDFTTKHGEASAIDQIAAMTYVLQAYEGWQNTNYIAGDIRSSKVTLRRASFTALGLLTVLYSLMTVAYYAVLPYDDVEESQWDISLLFARSVFGEGEATKVAVMLSTLSSLLINTYTAAKVKQAIAWQRIIPFADFFGKQDRQFNSPGGALVLHWIFTVIYLSTLPPNGQPFRFTTGLFTYGFEIMLIFLAIGIFLLPRRMRAIDPSWKPLFTRSIISRSVIVGVIIAMCILLLYSFAEPTDPGTVPKYWSPITLGIIVGAAIAYWGAINLLQATWRSKHSSESLGSRIGFEVFTNEPGNDVPDELAILMREAIADGGKRRLTLKVSGKLAVFTGKVKHGWKIVMRYLG